MGWGGGAKSEPPYAKNFTSPFTTMRCTAIVYTCVFCEKKKESTCKRIQVSSNTPPLPPQSAKRTEVERSFLGFSLEEV